MIPGWLGWGIALFAAGLTAACLLLPPLLRRHPVLAWPEDWRVAWRLRRGRRGMSDPGDRHES